jgi:hypothetical protein
MVPNPYLANLLRGNDLQLLPRTPKNGHSAHILASAFPTTVVANGTPNLPRSRCRSGSQFAAKALHSYRKISTGNSREAARAGKIVATVAMPMATTAIHTPSITLG